MAHGFACTFKILSVLWCPLRSLAVWMEDIECYIMGSADMEVNFLSKFSSKCDSEIFFALPEYSILEIGLLYFSLHFIYTCTTAAVTGHLQHVWYSSSSVTVCPVEGSRGSWSPYQLSLEEKRGTTRTGRRSISVLTQRDKQPVTLLCLWTMGGPTQAQGGRANFAQTGLNPVQWLLYYIIPWIKPPAIF